MYCNLNREKLVCKQNCCVLLQNLKHRLKHNDIRQIYLTGLFSIAVGDFPATRSITAKKIRKAYRGIKGHGHPAYV